MSKPEHQRDWGSVQDKCLILFKYNAKKSHCLIWKVSPFHIFTLFKNNCPVLTSSVKRPWYNSHKIKIGEYHGPDHIIC